MVELFSIIISVVFVDSVVSIVLPSGKMKTMVKSVINILCLTVIVEAFFNLLGVL
ncbi:MAG: hypothetical protein IJS68_01665 [Clostridia bacterium]|nr:hypothetical protein [Clostridia bacterium]